MTTDGVLILAGPTASGKTALAIDLAKRFDAEIVGADSRQIYAGMSIGTAAPSPVELAGVPHHLVGFLNPREPYSAARYAAEATEIIASIHARGKRAIVVGGTGFYLRALTGDVDLAPAYDSALRERLTREVRTHDAEFLYEWLRLRDAARASRLHPRDRYRVVRALEIALAEPGATLRTRPLRTLATDHVASLKVVLEVQAAELDARIERRTDAMLAGGLIEEAERVGADAVAANAVGYPQALAYLRGWCTRDELREQLARATRRYARRQRSWLRSEPGVTWTAADRVEALAREKLGWTVKPR
jgi:tRNA dimethylallyltransferase